MLNMNGLLDANWSIEPILDFYLHGFFFLSYFMLNMNGLLDANWRMVHTSVFNVNLPILFCFNVY
jgi:hypothetical protein